MYPAKRTRTLLVAPGVSYRGNGAECRMNSVRMPAPCLSATPSPSPASAPVRPGLPATIRPYGDCAVVLRLPPPGFSDDGGTPPPPGGYDYPAGYPPGTNPGDGDAPGSNCASTTTTRGSTAPAPLETRMGRLTPVGLAAARMRADGPSVVVICAARRRRGDTTPPPDEFPPRPVSPGGPDACVEALYALFTPAGGAEVLGLVDGFDPGDALRQRMTTAPDGGTVIEIDYCDGDDGDDDEAEETESLPGVPMLPPGNGALLIDAGEVP